MKPKILASVIFLAALGALQFPTLIQNSSISWKDSESTWVLPFLDRMAQTHIHKVMAQDYANFENLKTDIKNRLSYSEDSSVVAQATVEPIETHVELNFPGNSNTSPLSKAEPPVNSGSDQLPTPDSTLSANQPSNPISTPPLEQVASEAHNKKVILIGDSMMGDVAFALKRLNSKNTKPLEIENYHKVSTGLSNQTYFDWPRELERILNKTQLPQKTALVIFMGTNDAQNIVDNSKVLNFGTNDWQTVYEARAHKLLDVAKQKNISVYWIQVPSPGASRAAFAKRLAYVEQSQRNATVAYKNFSYVNTRSYLENMKDTRQSDDIHLNSTGANVVAEKVYAQIQAQKY